jgi:N-acetylglucosamine kinase-like BadF-type ATPase
MGLAKPADFIHAVYRGGWDRTALAGLAPVVLEVAESGDATAASIVAIGAGELAHAAATAAGQLRLDLGALPLAVAGGTLLGSEFYRQRFLGELGKRTVTPQPVTLVREPAAGAVRIARERRPLTV